MYIEYNLYMEKEAFSLPSRESFKGMLNFIKRVLPTMLQVSLGMWALIVAGILSGFIEEVMFAGNTIATSWYLIV